MNIRHALICLLLGGVVALVSTGPVNAAIETIDLVYEFDGDLPLRSYGTVTLEDAIGGGVDVTIVANTLNLGGGDIHEWYFNLPDEFGSSTTFMLSDFGGVSNDPTIGVFTMLGFNPSVAGGAGASFDWGVNFGNGGGFDGGNGTLTTATFNIDTTVGLSVSDFLNAPLSVPNNLPDDVPGVLVAVHFEDTYTPFDSETVGGLPEDGGGGQDPIPEPSAILVWLGLGGVSLGAMRLRRRVG